MSIHYVLIAKDPNISLADYATDTGNYQLVIANLLPKLQQNRLMYFKSGECTVYTYGVENLKFICLTDKEYRLEAACNFLEAVKQVLFQKFTPDQIKSMISLSTTMNKELQRLVDEYNQNPESDKAKMLITELAELKNTAAQNLSKKFVGHYSSI